MFPWLLNHWWIWPAVTVGGLLASMVGFYVVHERPELSIHLVLGGLYVLLAGLAVMVSLLLALKMMD